MKKIFVNFLPIFFAYFLTTNTMASSNLEVSPTSDFSNQTPNYNSGQTVYIRLSTNSSGDKTHLLSVRDNKYNQISTYNLSKNGNQFTTSITAPSSEGYYSLEAKIESEGSQTTAVKTIKIGNPKNANVNVSISSHVSGQTVLGETSQSSPSPSSTTVYRESANPESSPYIASEITDNTNSSTSGNQQAGTEKNKGAFFKVKIIFLKIVDFVWPFN